MFFLSKRKGTFENQLSVLLKRCIIFFTFQVASYVFAMTIGYYKNTCLASIYFNIY